MRRPIRTAWVIVILALAVITVSPALADPTGQATQPIVIVPELANVRAGPGTVYDQLGTLTAGQSAPALGRSAASDWIQIEFPAGLGGTGWVYAPFVELQGGTVESLPVQSIPPTPTLPPTPATQPELATVLAVTPTHLPTFTSPPEVTLATFENPEPGRRGLPWTAIILALFGLGVFGAVMAFVRRNT